MFATWGLAAGQIRESLAMRETSIDLERCGAHRYGECGCRCGRKAARMFLMATQVLFSYAVAQKEVPLTPRPKGIDGTNNGIRLFERLAKLAPPKYRGKDLAPLGFVTAGEQADRDREKRASSSRSYSGCAPARGARCTART